MNGTLDPFQIRRSYVSGNNKLKLRQTLKLVYTLLKSDTNLIREKLTKTQWKITLLHHLRLSQ